MILTRQIPPQNHVSTFALHDDDLDLTGEVYGLAPVQAEGRVWGQEFYFRARNKHWTFVIAPPNETVWECSRPDAVNGLFGAPAGWGYQSSGTYAAEPCADGDLSFDAVAQLIRREASQFLAQVAKAQ